jgi:hypothetical protein
MPANMAVSPLRVFSESVEVLAKQWRSAALSTDSWKATGKAGEQGGEAQGYHVTCGTLNAYAKPSTPNPNPRAANEKIASDLAYDLGLPLPPVVLHKWSQIPVGTQACVALSLIPFLAVHKWAVVKAVPELEKQLKSDLQRAASAMVAFDTWLQNSDRANDGNLLVSRADLNPGESLRVAYIDYSNSLLHGWLSSDYKSITPVGIYPDGCPVDETTVRETVDKIEAISDAEIKTVVERIPDEFFTDSKKEKSLAIEGLIYRKSKIRESLAGVYGGCDECD